MPEYDATFRDERVNDSADDRPVPELNNKDKVLLQRALAYLYHQLCEACRCQGQNSTMGGASTFYT
jgi:hypothetical protein